MSCYLDLRTGGSEEKEEEPVFDIIAMTTLWLNSMKQTHR